MSATAQRQTSMHNERHSDRDIPSPMGDLVDGEAHQAQYTREDQARYLYAKYVSFAFQI